MKKKNYLLTALIIAIIISFVYLVKGIFPFGKNFAIWSDLHEQITAMFYHFYDSIKGSDSLFIDFTSGGSINFIGLIGYYICSPFTFLTLLFPRDLLAHSISIIVALKIITSGVTFLYCINKFFKNIPDYFKILFSILYAFCGYNLLLYIITPWIDVVYLFPLLLVGLKKLLDTGSSKMYIIILSMSLIFCFYISLMVLLFVIMGSGIYLYLKKEKKNNRRIIFNLGVSTVISLLISSVILVPTMIQILNSQRAGFDMNLIMNSRLGPLSDKLVYFFISGLSIGLLLLIIIKSLKEKKKLLFLFGTSLLFLIPILIEPSNKLFHFGSYVSFPLRYGFIPIVYIMFIAIYYLNNLKEEKSSKKNKYITAIITLVGSLSLILMTSLFYSKFQVAVDKLSFTYDTLALILIFGMFIITTFVSFTIGLLNKNKSKFTFTMFAIVSITNILSMNFVFIGIDFDQKDLQDRYTNMIDIYNDKTENEIYFIKRMDNSLIRNFGMVTGYRTYSNFTSLTDKNNFEVMQRLGYDSSWIDTESAGGNLFMDIVLGNKYMIGEYEYNNEYYEFVKKYNTLNFYKLKKEIPYGLLIDDNYNISNSRNSFDASNKIYKSITGEDHIFTIYNDFKVKDIKIEEKNDMIHYSKTSDTSYFEKEIKVQNKSKLYFEVFNTFDNREKRNIHGNFAIYINGELFHKGYPEVYHNGVIELGTFENETVNIRIELLNDSEVMYMNLGLLGLEKLETIFNINTPLNIKFADNKINIDIETNKDKILFLPVTYLKGYKATNNDKEIEVLKVFDNYIGIKLNKGTNVIEIKYTSEGFNLGLLLSKIGLILAFVWISFIEMKTYKILNNITYYLFIIANLSLILIFYVIPIIFFFISFLS